MARNRDALSEFRACVVKASRLRSSSIVAAWTYIRFTVSVANCITRSLPSRRQRLSFQMNHEPCWPSCGQ
jgi:hypothetical protein